MWRVLAVLALGCAFAGCGGSSQAVEGPVRFLVKLEREAGRDVKTVSCLGGRPLPGYKTPAGVTAGTVTSCTFVLSDGSRRDAAAGLNEHGQYVRVPVPPRAR